jgi:uncharacterized membrane protein
MTNRGGRTEQTGSDRMNNFVDAAFAFSASLLVISGGSMPTNAAEIEHALLQVPSFLLSFALVARMWLSHRSWASKYMLDDTISTLLSLSVVALVMIFIFPIHAMFQAFTSAITAGALPARFTVSSVADLRTVYFSFGVMFVSFGSAFALLYWRAYAMREVLALSFTDARMALGAAFGFLWMVLIGVISVVATDLIIWPPLSPWVAAVPPSLYFLLMLIGPIERWIAAGKQEIGR